MNPRKRLASETLFPARSAKHPRTTGERYTGGENASASQLEGLGARWMKFFNEACNLFGETIAQITEGFKHKQEAAASTQSLPLLPPSLLPFQNPSTPLPSFNSNLPSHTPITLHFPGPTGPPPRSSRSIPEPTVPMIIDAPSLPSTVTVTASTASIPSSSNFVDSYPQIGRAIARSEQRIRRTSSPRKYQTRQHIYAETHKANVQANKKKDREAQKKELYNLTRSTGYDSDFESFKSLLNYRARLELLARGEALVPSPSLTDLRSKSLAHPSNRRHSFSHEDTFLERALANAKKTLNGPKPPKPFIPNFEQLRISARAKDEEIEQRLRPKPKPLPSSLPPKDEDEVNAILRQRGVVSKHAREQVLDQDLLRLKPGQWLNDEIINFYGSMILARAEASKENPAENGVNGGKGKPLNAHYFSTFFWSKLKGEGYEKARLAKWTKKFDLFSKDVVLIPVNHNNAHWTSAAINFRQKRIESYDSMGMDRGNVFKLLRHYLDAEHRNKRKKPFDFTGWEDYVLEVTPQQENGFDCGVFTCQFLERLSRGEEYFNFTQADMPYLRRLMIWEIGHAKLRSES